MHTLLPASEEAFESGTEERASTLKQALRESSVTNSHLATRVLAAYFFYRAVDLDTRPVVDEDDSGGGEDDDSEYWTKQQDIGNDLLSLLVRLPPSLRLPQNSSCPHAIFINIMIHTATMCLHKTAIRNARGHEGPDAEFHTRQSRSRMFAAAAQTLAVFRLTEHLVVTLRNPIQDYAAHLAALVFLEDYALEGKTQSRSNAVFLLNTLRTARQSHAVAQMLAGQLMAEMERLGIQTAESTEVRSPSPQLACSCFIYWRTT